jgi:hypothetical protein
VGRDEAGQAEQEGEGGGDAEQVQPGADLGRELGGQDDVRLPATLVGSA